MPDQTQLINIRSDRTPEEEEGIRKEIRESLDKTIKKAKAEGTPLPKHLSTFRHVNDTRKGRRDFRLSVSPNVFHHISTLANLIHEDGKPRGFMFAKDWINYGPFIESNNSAWLDKPSRIIIPESSWKMEKHDRESVCHLNTPEDLLSILVPKEAILKMMKGCLLEEGLKYPAGAAGIGFEFRQTFDLDFAAGTIVKSTLYGCFRAFGCDSQRVCLDEFVDLFQF